MHEHAKLIEPLLLRLRATSAGGTYPLDPVERELMLTEIGQLRAALKAMYERYVTEDGWSVEPECHVLARRALRL